MDGAISSQALSKVTSKCRDQGPCSGAMEPRLPDPLEAPEQGTHKNSTHANVLYHAYVGIENVNTTRQCTAVTNSTSPNSHT